VVKAAEKAVVAEVAAAVPCKKVSSQEPTFFHPLTGDSHFSLTRLAISRYSCPMGDCAL